MNGTGSTLSVEGALMLAPAIRTTILSTARRVRDAKRPTTREEAQADLETASVLQVASDALAVYAKEHGTDSEPTGTPFAALVLLRHYDRVQQETPAPVSPRMVLGLLRQDAGWRAALADLAAVTEAERVKAFRADLEAKVGKTWTTDEMRAEFEVLRFCCACICVVKRKSDGKKGSLEFTHSPRFYFGWVEES